MPARCIASPALPIVRISRQSPISSPGHEKFAITVSSGHWFSWGALPSSVDAHYQDPQPRKVTPLSVNLAADNNHLLPFVVLATVYSIFF